MKETVYTFLFVLLFCVVGSGQRNCGSMEILENQIQKDPRRLFQLEQIEEHTKAYLRSPNNSRETYVIPVVVHIVYNEGIENISDAQVHSQIQVLNEDFRRLNSDANNTWSQAADVEIQFCLASVDPEGNSTSGITRTSTTQTSFSTNDAMKFTSSGGKDGWPASQYMNIWVCDIGGGVLGYAQFPGGPSSTDGVVIDYQYFGTIGTATAPFHLGRTGTHEVGHYLNLRHIWGDGGCSVDDLVADTPVSGGPNYGCAKGQISCSSVDMVENYMDYSDDGCMNLFTQGQKTRMRALFASGGFRASLLSSPGCGDNNGSLCFDGVQNGDETDIDCGGSCSPCPEVCTQNVVNINLVFDNYPQETSWHILNSSGQTVASGGPYGNNTAGSSASVEICLPNGCYNFVINDSYGDGMCCSFGSGSYTVLNGSTVLASGGSFGSSETKNFCVQGASEPSCSDGIQNQGETGIDCGGPCSPCPVTPSCSDGVQNQGETGIDCGGPCAPCPVTPTCDDGVQNGNETGVDCGGPDCAPCGGTGGGNIFGHYFESGWDGWTDGGSDCARVSSSTYAFEGNYSIQLRDDSGPASSMTSPSYNLQGQSNLTFSFSFRMNSMEDGEDFFLDFYNGSSWVRLATYVAGSTFVNGTFYTISLNINSGLSSNNRFRFTCDASTNSDQVYIDAVTLTSNSGGGGPTCSDGIKNGNETGVDCGGPDCPACPVTPTCDDGIQNGNETGVDCGGPDCPACPVTPTCDDGIQNGNETGVDCGGTDCPACPVTPTCTDGVQNGNETGVDCGGPQCPACPTCTDGVQNGSETGVDCGGPDCAACPTCTDGVQNGNETGIDCGGPDCAPCGGTGGVNLFGNGHYFETGWDGWADGGSDCARVASSYYAAEGNYSIQLRDNSGVASSMTSPSVNLNSYSYISLEFGMYANSMETGEQILIKFGNNGSFTTVVAASSGTDFSNGIHYTVTIDLPSSAVSFGSNNQIRIECNGSTNSDQLYIDAVKLTGYAGSLAGLESNVNFEAHPTTANTFTSNTLFYPNPASDILNIELGKVLNENDDEAFEYSKVNLSIYSITGQVVKTVVLDQSYGSNHRIDISDLPAGTYLARAVLGDEPVIEKIQIIR